MRSFEFKFEKRALFDLVRLHLELILFSVFTTLNLCTLGYAEESAGLQLWDDKELLLERIEAHVRNTTGIFLFWFISCLFYVTLM